MSRVTPIDRIAERERMVAEQIVARGIRDPRVLAALRTVPRELFVPAAAQDLAYDDRPLSIGDGQTISQPYIVAITLASLGLAGTERVLEIGTGSGYVAALLTLLARRGEVYSIERLSSLARSAQARLESCGYPVHVKDGDGTLGWPEHAPFDAIAVSAAGPYVPEALLEQTAPGGRVVIPVRRGSRQVLLRVIRMPGDGVQMEPIEDVCFVPLIGAQGEPER